MKRIKTFENYNFDKKSDINESEVESIITDISSDFMDDYNVVPSFTWGWYLLETRSYYKDSEVDIFIEAITDNKVSVEIRLKLEHLIESIENEGKRCVTVSFNAPYGYSNFKIWKIGMDIDFLNLMKFVKNYTKTTIRQDGNISPDIWACGFKVIF